MEAPRDLRGALDREGRPGAGDVLAEAQQVAGIEGRRSTIHSRKTVIWSVVGQKTSLNANSFAWPRPRSCDDGGENDRISIDINAGAPLGLRQGTHAKVDVEASLFEFHRSPLTARVMQFEAQKPFSPSWLLARVVGVRRKDWYVVDGDLLGVSRIISR
jgi:hypothetical protein